MSESKELLSLFSKCREHQQQLNVVFTQVSNEVTLSAIKRLKAQVLLLSDWLFTLSEQNSDFVLAQALRHPTYLLPHTNQSFIAAIIMAKFTHRLHYHGQHGRLLISAALTMNISLFINKNALGVTLYKHHKLSTEQHKQYQQYPLASAQFLNKYHIIDKSALHSILGHKELLNGSGFPAQLKEHKISINMQLLGIIARFTELTSPRENKACATIKQVMSYFLKHQQQFNVQLINHFINLVDKPLPGFIYPLNKTHSALIIKHDVLNDELEYISFSIDEGALHLAKEAQKSLLDYQRQYIVPPEHITEEVLANYLIDYVDDPIEDISDQTQRLKPNNDLSLLLTELNAHLPDKNAVSALIAQQPILGDYLIESLKYQFPSKQFNSSYHAMQMIGFNQVQPLLSRLALDTQISHFQFPTAIDLKQKINCAVQICYEIGLTCRHIMPNQLAMFTQLNLSSLYLEHRIINNQVRQKISFEHCHIYHAASLVGSNNTLKQLKISTALAKMWAPQKSVINALACIAQPDLPRAAKERELVAGFELAIYLTHGVFHGIVLTERETDNHFKKICRDLKLSVEDINKLQQMALTAHPFCSL